MKDKKDKIQIAFPSVGLIVLLAFICGIVKLCGGCSYSWLHALVIVPVGLYMGWCLFWIVVAICMAVLAKLVSSTKA